MNSFKDFLGLLAIFIAYGIAGRPDYEDAVALVVRRLRCRTKHASSSPAQACRASRRRKTASSWSRKAQSSPARPAAAASSLALIAWPTE